MEDLKTAVNESISKIINDGTVNQMIEEQIKKTVQSLITEQLKDWSDFGKALKEKITKELTVNLDNITFAEHNKTLVNLVEGIFNNAITKEAESKFKSDLLEIFSPPPSEIKFSEIISQYIEENQDEYDRDDSESIGLVIERKDNGWIGVGLHPSNTDGTYNSKPIERWQQCELYLSVQVDENNKGRLSWTYDKSGLRPHQFMPTCLRGTARLLYQMYCGGSTLIFDKGSDVEDYDIYYPEPY